MMRWISVLIYLSLNMYVLNVCRRVCTMKKIIIGMLIFSMVAISLLVSTTVQKEDIIKYS